ncbi:hypothetical protein ACOMHN_007866 [Nucella lapillus]
MKTVLTSILLCASLQVVWFSFSIGQTAPSCSSLNSTNCCDDGLCAFFNCSNKIEGACIPANASSSSACLNETAIPVCNGSAIITTPNPQPDPCNKYTENVNLCCTAAAEKCGMYNCTDTASNVTRPECAKLGSSCGAEKSSPDMCPHLKPTTAPATIPSTGSPDVCGSFATNQTQCCDVALTHECAFYNCTGAQQSTTACHNKTALDAICTDGAKAVEIPSPSPPSPPTTTTTAKASSSQTPTKSPSTGGDGGRKFDGASFIGGIVLCAGLVALGYFSLKFYKSRQERNYHTL